MRFLKQNTATRVTVGPFMDKTDGVTPETALTVTNCKLTLMVDDGGVPTLVLDAAATASAGNNDMVHVTNDDAGFYDLELTASQTNYVGRAMLSITDAANHCPVFHEFMILPANVYDSLMGTDTLDVQVTGIGNDAITAAAIAADAGTEIGAAVKTAIEATGSHLTLILGDTGTTLPSTLSTILTDTDELQKAITDGGRTDLLIDAIKAKTDLMLAAADIRTAVGLAAANLDTQIATLATAANLATLDTLVDRMAPLLVGTVTGAGTGTEVYAYGGVTATVTVDVDGNVSGVVFS